MQKKITDYFKSNNSSHNVTKQLNHVKSIEKQDEKEGNLENSENFKNSELIRELEYAISEEDEYYVEELLLQGVNPNGVVKSKKGKDISVLEYAMQNEEMNRKIVKLLIKSGADIKSPLKSHFWMIDNVFELLLGQATQHDDSELLEIILNVQNDANKKFKSCSERLMSYYKDVWFPIHNVVKDGAIECLKVLLKYGAEVDKIKTSRHDSDFGDQQDSRETPLHIACKLEEKVSSQLAQVLIENGADVNSEKQFIERERKPESKNKDENSVFTDDFNFFFIQERPIHISIKSGNAKTLFRLLKQGAEIVPYLRDYKPIPTEQLIDEYEKDIGLFIKFMKFCPDLFNDDSSYDEEKVKHKQTEKIIKFKNDTNEQNLKIREIMKNIWKRRFTNNVFVYLDPNTQNRFLSCIYSFKKLNLNKYVVSQILSFIPIS